MRDNEIYMYIYIKKWKKLLNFFALRGNEIKYVGKQRKLFHFFPTCGNKRITCSPVSLLDIFLKIFGSNMNHYVEVKRIGEIETKI